MNKPKILLSVRTKKESYINAVEKCGGIAVTEYSPEFYDEYDGLILCGGNDIDPKHYGEEITDSVDIDGERDEAELELFEKFVEMKKPILGICRGCQLINIALGGSLYQNISNADKHNSFADYDLVHEIKAKENTFLYELFGEEFSVNSFHHQAIKKLGKDIEVVATAFDGTTVEAIKHKELPVYAVQWHPERMTFDYKRDDTVDGARVFEFFLELCRNN